MAALTESRLSAIDDLARSRKTALDRVVLELVAEVRRLRQQVGDGPVHRTERDGGAMPPSVRPPSP